MSIGTVLLIILVIILLGGFSGFGDGPFCGTGCYGGGGLGLILVIVLILGKDRIISERSALPCALGHDPSRSLSLCRRNPRFSAVAALPLR